ncbi:unnamed protein product [Soboliphyme baturini]|uniref:Thyroglobulin type-1 domain-containing protein n=1 Tax=Soboliphyme baturini TaxID=241478 RepID=A0A183J5M2_9BILA|nr:unnamed protein product [Soboliphyme baturini]
MPSFVECEEQRDAAKSADRSSKSKIFIDAAFVPQCNKDGSFKPIQCDNFARVCWCVDKDGLEIHGSRSVGEAKPNCSASSSVYTSVSDVSGNETSSVVVSSPSVECFLT